MAKPLRPDSIGVLHGIGYSPPGREYAPIVPQGRWKKRASRLLGAMRLNPSVARDFHPFLKDAELWLEAAMGQLAGAAGGVCGPIESQALATTAWQLAYSRYWMWKASEDPTNLKLVETASRMADAARANALAAYDMAVKLFRVRHVAETDPLASGDKPVVKSATLDDGSTAVFVLTRTRVSDTSGNPQLVQQQNARLAQRSGNGDIAAYFAEARRKSKVVKNPKVFE